MTTFERLRSWARRLKRDVLVLWIAARDPRTPLAAKLVAAAVAAYALSPIDLIPDFVPVLGYLDDVILVPLGIALAIRLIPSPLIGDFRAKASALTQRPRSGAGLLVILALWLTVVAALGAWLWDRWVRV